MTTEHILLAGIGLIIALIGLMLRRMDRLEDRMQGQIDKLQDQMNNQMNKLFGEIKNLSERVSRIEGMLVGPDLLREHIITGRKAKKKEGQPKKEKIQEDA